MDPKMIADFLVRSRDLLRENPYPLMREGLAKTANGLAVGASSAFAQRFSPLGYLMAGLPAEKSKTTERFVAVREAVESFCKSTYGTDLGGHLSQFTDPEQFQRKFDALLVDVEAALRSAVAAYQPPPPTVGYLYVQKWRGLPRCSLLHGAAARIPHEHHLDNPAERRLIPLTADLMALGLKELRRQWLTFGALSVDKVGVDG